MHHEVEAKTLTENVFSLIGEQWMLVTAGSAARCNTMTASWGGLGVLWHKPVATIYVRPQRYTKEFIEREECFTLSFFAEQYRPQLALCGAKSGRETDKVKETGFTVVESAEGAPYFDEAELVLVCKKRYYSDLDPSHFLDPDIEKNYPARDYHRMYIGEITRVLRKG